MSAIPPYRGYSVGREYFSQPDRTFTVPQHGYFALGDNSYNSYDSRYWGAVPEENLVGHGLLVYWPFAPHWGLIRQMILELPGIAQLREAFRWCSAVRLVAPYPDMACYHVATLPAHVSAACTWRRLC